MWVDRKLFQHVLDDNKQQQLEIVDLRSFNRDMVARVEATREQKAKDDITIDWMRHRVNALEKQNALLLGKATGLAFPIAEIVPTRPGTITLPDNYSEMPDFEDVGDERAVSLGLKHDEAGYLKDQTVS